MPDFSQFDELQKAGLHYEANRLLFKWLSDDDARVALYRHLLDRKKRVLEFQSRADTKTGPTGESEFHQDVYLLSAREDVERALTDTANFSNEPYQALGSGTFMLGLDGGDHGLQREFASAFLHVDAKTIATLSTLAFKAAAVLPLKRRQFDLVELAEQVALRFVGFLFGFAQADHPKLEATMRQAYLGLNYQILGRHFVSAPGVIDNANTGMGALLQRVAYLIDLYRECIGQEQEDEYQVIDLELKELREYTDEHNRRPLEKFVPVLRTLAERERAVLIPKQRYSGTELAVIVVGLIAGTIGNVQASVSIAINAFFDPRNRVRKNGQEKKVLEIARDAANRTYVENPDAVPVLDPELLALVWEALRLHPPVAFLPRRTKHQVEFPRGGDPVPANSIVILAMGAATRDGLVDPDTFDHERTGCADIHPLIFGGPPPLKDTAPGGRRFMHQCIGQHLAMPLITHIVRQVLLLEGLVQSLDPLTAEPERLRKRWGFNCQSYPLEFDRFKLLKHTPLNVVMKIKMPVSEHAERLKLVIKYGAPRIEKHLRDAKHVHFAWFEFLENDTKLALHTVYDRDFDTYIEHFALQIGPLFDKLFEHIQDAPPRPVKEFPKEFIDTIRRYDTRPAADYFFSAYPKVETAMIVNHFTGKKT